jgi:hypothetical protein
MDDQTARDTPCRDNSPLYSPLPFQIGGSGGPCDGGGDRPGAWTWGTKATGFVDAAVDEIGDTDIVQNVAALADLAQQAASALVRAATTWALELPEVLRA